MNAALLLVACVVSACGGSTSPPPVPVEQPAVWPATDVVMATPEAAARDYVEQVLRVPAVLGPFQQGDQRSGEMEVFVRTEGAGPPRLWPRSLLFMRQLGPDDGWFVLGAVSEHVTITSPDTGAVVPAAPLTVTGEGRGFEATLVVTAFVQGNPEPLDQVVTYGGGLDLAEPYAAQLDLSGAPPGSVVVIMARGGVGLETDPGEFAALPIVMKS